MNSDIANRPKGCQGQFDIADHAAEEPDIVFFRSLTDIRYLKIVSHR